MHKRKMVSVNDRQHSLLDYQLGNNRKEIVHKLGISNCTFSAWLKKKEEILSKDDVSTGLKKIN